MVKTQIAEFRAADLDAKRAVEKQDEVTKCEQELERYPFPEPGLHARSRGGGVWRRTLGI